MFLFFYWNINFWRSETVSKIIRINITFIVWVCDSFKLEAVSVAWGSLLLYCRALQINGWYASKLQFWVVEGLFNNPT